MRELSFVIALIAGLVLMVAVGAWLRIARRPRNDLVEGEGGKPISQRATWASRLIVVALGLSGLAAAIAVIAWFMT